MWECVGIAGRDQASLLHCPRGGMRPFSFLGARDDLPLPWAISQAWRSVTGVVLLLQVSCGLNHTAAVIELAHDAAREAAADLAKDKQ